MPQFTSTDRLYAAYHRRLVAYALRFVDEVMDAEDIVQNSYYKYLKRYGHKSQEEFSRLIFAIVRNNCLNHLKEKKLRKGIISGLPDNIDEALYAYDFLGPEADLSCLSHEIQKQVNQVIDSLPTECRRIFLMNRKEGMTNAAIAESLGISEQTVKNQMSKALAVFRKKFK